MRTLRSKRLRNALWMGSNGKCELCGTELVDWHADHTRSWVEGGRTNVHEMWALCPRCNLRKGSTSMKRLRYHQREMRDRAREIVDGTIRARTTVAHVTPGGGKTYGGQLFASILGLPVTWVVPRKNLALQVEHDCAKSGLSGVRLRLADNVAPLVRGRADGYVTTYHAVAAQPRLHLDEALRGKRLLILDEPHHLADDEKATWHRAVTPLMDEAGHVLMMTGTIERHDRRRIPGIKYEPNADGVDVPVADIEYTLRRAYNERAVIPVDFTYHRGFGEWVENGELKNADLSSQEDMARALKGFLAPGSVACRDMIRRGVSDFVEYRRCKYPSKAIIICDSQKMARVAVAQVKSEFRVNAALAISDERKAARVIDAFRKGIGPSVLVTVGMAYEGLDVPDCSHIVCLTSIRSEPWLVQAFARSTRVADSAHGCSLPYEQQFAQIYVPDDPRMRDVVARMKKQMPRGIKEREVMGPRPGVDWEPPDVRYIGGEVTGASYGTVGDDFSDDESSFVDLVRARIPNIKSESASQLIMLLRDHRSMDTTAPATVDVRTPSELEDTLRKECQQLASSIDRHRGWERGTANKRVVERFGKRRTTMSYDELQRCKVYLAQMSGGIA